MTTRLIRNRETYQSKIPDAPKKRSIFPARWNRKQTMNASYITPIMCKRIIPGQTMNLNMSAFVRMSTQLVAPIDNLFIETFFFYAPDRILWDNHREFLGEVKNPTQQQVERLIPQIEISAEENIAGSLWNYISASRLGKKCKVSKLPFVMHNMVQNRFFRDPDCQDYKPIDTTDTAGNLNDYALYRIHKSRDMITNATRDVQQGEPVTIPFATEAPVIGNGMALGLDGASSTSGIIGYGLRTNNEGIVATYSNLYGAEAGIDTSNSPTVSTRALGLTKEAEYSGVIADLTNSKATLDALAQAIMTQQYLQALNRGGTKYTDIMSNIYSCDVFDYSIQEPVYLGGTHTPFFTTPVVQTSGTGTTGQATPQGNISGYGVGGDGGRVINASFSEFGYVIGYMVIKAQPQYQQGLDSHWTERDRLELFNPFYVNAPDEPIYRERIFQEDYDAVDEVDGTPLNKKVYGYIGRYDKYRYNLNEIAGELNSEYKYSQDYWHYAEKFENAPENNADFMEDKTYEILDRTLAVIWENQIGTDENGDPVTPEGEELVKAPQFIVDIQFEGFNSLPIPTHAVPKISAML